ncbi:MAG: PepSY domain-containing protein [Rhabdaerophilum sp.]
MLRPTLPLLLACGLAVPAAAQSIHDPYCSRLPRVNWLSSSEIAQELQQRGLQLVEIRLADQKCYAVRVQNAAGKREDLILDPMTGDVMR